MKRFCFKILTITILGAFCSCSSFEKLKLDIIEDNSKIGVLILINDLEYTRIANTPVKRVRTYWKTYQAKSTPNYVYNFKKIFDEIENDVYPYDKISSYYLQLLSSFGRRVKIFDDNYSYDLDELEIYEPSYDSEKYFNRDLRFLNDSNSIRYLFLVRVRHGVFSKFFQGNENVRNCNTYIFTKIIDLEDNSIIYSNKSEGLIPLDYTINEPKFLKHNFTLGINESTEKAIISDKIFMHKLFVMDKK